MQSEELRRQINTGLGKDDYLEGKARLYYMKEDHAMTFFHIILHPAVLIYNFHIFITSKTI